jgi:gluconolactonase
MKHIFFISLVISIFSSAVKGQENNLVNILQPGAKLEKVADGFLFTEGPTADELGNVYFTDQPNDRILLWNEQSGLSVFMQPSGRSNGLALDNKGNLISCADEKNEIWQISPEKNIIVLASGFGSKLFNGPNDLWISPSGRIYFTDPFYVRSWWNHKEMPQEKQRVYFLDPLSKIITIAAGDLLQPNGIVGTPDGKVLYVADIRANKTWAYRINPDGSLSGKKLHCEMGSDGMTIDSEGNLYLTGKGVTIFDKEGKKLGNIEVPENWTANVCFGGKDRKTLFITASTGFYLIRLKVKGTAG